MLQIILLLNPIYVTLLWALELNINTDKSPPRTFLGKFMINAFIMFVCYLLYYYPFDTYYYYYADNFLCLTLLLLFPLYYIYIRLLTVDKKFSLKKHFKYLASSIIMFIIFTVSLYSISPKEHYDLAYNNDIEINGRLLFYTIIENITRIFYLLHSIYFTILSFIQIIRHKKSIQNYYANYEESRIKKIYTLNIAVSVSSVIFIIFSFLDKNFFIEKEHLFIIPSLIIMCMFFIIGLLGNNQHSAIIDPEASSENIPSENINPTQLETIKKKIEYLFEVDKIYLNKELNLWELSRLINTNRTYITLLIGNYYNKNFSTFVNHYRLKHVENLLNKNPELTNEDLANLSGFGSVISMQRAFQNIEGKTISQIKKKIIRSKFDTNQE